MALPRQPVHIEIPAFQNLNDLRVEALAGFGAHDRDRFFERHGAPVLAIRGERVQAIDRRQNPRAHGNLLAG